ncbi:MAG TPA: SLC13 family permease [Candidatus Nitrosocosmicus sp.]
MLKIIMQEYIIASTIFGIIYFLIILGRKLFHIPIWLAMVIGAILMLGFHVISWDSAIKSINLDVIGFLFGMFSIVTALDKSGVIKLMAVHMLAKAKNINTLILIFVLCMGILSAFLVNDTIALLGIPLVIYISKYTGIRPVILLLSLAFSISIGSTMTPIGNPQNLLIAIQSGISLPFTTFITHLTIPTIINLILTSIILKIYFRKDLLTVNIKAIQDKYIVSKNIDSFDDKDFYSSFIIENPYLAKTSSVILLITISGFIISEFLHFFHIASVNMSIIALSGAAILYIFNNGSRIYILRNIDYSVLVFFVAMFIVTSSLWSSGVISMLMSYIPSPDPNNFIQSSTIISIISIFLSQLLSNVPFVAFYNLEMLHNGFAGDLHINQWMILASASTIAGNLTLLGAASNIIINDIAEYKGLKSFTFFEFLKIGFIITIINMIIYYLFIVII